MSQLLYDFDYESNRISLIQAVLLLTRYYEKPDDPKDTYYWMSMAVNTAYAIGLNHITVESAAGGKHARLRRRIWWVTYMRDRLIALGLRRPMLIRPEDYSVPMLTQEDFSLEAIPDSVSCIPSGCSVARDVEKQRQLASMCIEKAKLCLCMGDVLEKHYYIANHEQSAANDKTTTLLLPRIPDLTVDEVQSCHNDLVRWQNELPPEANYSLKSSRNPSIDLHRSLLHMIYFTVVSTLHRPRAPCSLAASQKISSDGTELLYVSSGHVRRAAAGLASISRFLDSLGLATRLPVTGVSALLSALIVYLFNIKAVNEAKDRSSILGFSRCMQVMIQLRDLYVAADHGTAILEAACDKLDIKLSFVGTGEAGPLKAEVVTTVQDLVDAGIKLERTKKIETKARMDSLCNDTSASNDVDDINTTEYTFPSTLNMPPELLLRRSNAMPTNQCGSLVDKDMYCDSTESQMKQPLTDHQSKHGSSAVITPITGNELFEPPKGPRIETSGTTVLEEDMNFFFDFNNFDGEGTIVPDGEREGQSDLIQMLEESEIHQNYPK